MRFLRLFSQPPTLSPDSEEPNPQSPIPNPRSPATRRILVLLIKAALAVLVIWAVARHVMQTWQELHSQGRSVRLDPAWLAVSVVLYLVGLSCFGVFYWQILSASPTPVRLAAAVRAYLVSHLGKYVPGKAMVVVIRAGLVVPYGARPATAAFATLYETLIMMAAGGLLAAAGFALWRMPALPISLGSQLGVRLSPTALSLALGVAFLFLTLPAVFPRLSAWVSIPFPGVGPDALPRFSGALLVSGLIYASIGWTLLGVSQVAVVRALTPTGVALNLWPLVVASVALATVSGFVVAILPGGLGVRELVIMITLAPAVGSALAVVAALALRLAWVIGEVLVAVGLSVARPPLPRRTETC